MRRLKITFENKAGRRHTFITQNFSELLSNEEIVAIATDFLAQEQFAGNGEFEKIVKIRIVEKKTQKLFSCYHYKNERYYIANKRMMRKQL